MIRVLIPTFRDHMLERCLASLEASQTGSSTCVLILDNGLDGAWTGVERLRVPHDPFVAAQAFNIGCDVYPDDDIVWLDDAAEVVSDAWLTKLTRLQDRRDVLMNYGVLIFGQTTTQATYGRQPQWYEILDIPDVAMGAGIFVPRRTLHDIGGMDEALVGYGFDDFDYGLRCYHAGLKLGITGAVQLQSAEQASGWVARLGSYEAVLARLDINADIYSKKWTGQPASRPLVITRPRMDEHWLQKTCHCRPEMF